jgi:hypothetical protein
MNTLYESVQLKGEVDSLLSFLYSDNLTSVTGAAYSEIYGAICHLVFEATPRIFHESLENTIRKRQNEYTK